jgi:hypothetical protein
MDQGDNVVVEGSEGPNLDIKEPIPLSKEDFTVNEEYVLPKMEEYPSKYHYEISPHFFYSYTTSTPIDKPYIPLPQSTPNYTS